MFGSKRAASLKNEDKKKKDKDRRPSFSGSDPDTGGAFVGTELPDFRFDQLQIATGHFSAACKLGEGAFGTVFKGRLRDGREVAVKKLAPGSRHRQQQLRHEPRILADVQHRNVVRLLGSCSHGEHLYLVNEYVPRGSLEDLLFSSDAGCPRGGDLDTWRRRFKLIDGVARGLHYLHHGAPTEIIHCDVKAANVLLDGSWEPKIADFGVARFFPLQHAHHASQLAGTLGYMAPEYRDIGRMSLKADVYSFGVLVLEIAAGRKNYSPPFPGSPAGSLVRWAWELYAADESIRLADPALLPELQAAPEKDQLAMCVHLGLLCTQPDPALRPEMRRVTVALTRGRRLSAEPVGHDAVFPGDGGVADGSPGSTEYVRYLSIGSPTPDCSVSSSGGSSPAVTSGHRMSFGSPWSTPQA